MVSVWDRMLGYKLVLVRGSVDLGGVLEHNKEKEMNYQGMLFTSVMVLLIMYAKGGEDKHLSV